MKIGFIGTGKMAKKIIQGFLNQPNLHHEFYLSSQHPENLKDYAQKNQLHVCENNIEVVQQVDNLFIGVPPEKSSEVLKEIAPFIQPEEQLIFSFMTGIFLTDLEKDLGPVKLIRLMPNINVAINEGSIAYCFHNALDEEDKKESLAFLQPLGQLYPLPEKDFNTFVALAGSAPAFVYLFIDALARNGVKYGLTKELSTKIVADMVSASGKMVADSKENPYDLIDTVSSPGGSTVCGVLALQREGFFQSIESAIKETIEKDQEKKS